MATFFASPLRLAASALIIGAMTVGLTQAGLAEQASTKNAYEKYISGHRLNDTGQYSEAITVLTQALKEDPKLSDAYISRGFSYSKLGNYASAILDYLRALEIQPQSAYAHNNLGFTYLRNGNYVKAIDEFNIALKLIKDGGTSAIYAKRAEAFLRLGDLDRAVIDAEQSIKLDPTDHDPYETAAEAYLQKGNEEKALENLRAALDQKYDSSSGFHDRAETQFTRANVLEQTAKRAYAQSKSGGYPVETARMLQAVKQSIAFSDSGSSLKKSVEEQIAENNFKGVTCKALDANCIEIEFAEPLDAKLYCRNMGWSRAYAVSTDPHQNSWRIMLADNDESAQQNDNTKRRIAARGPQIGAWQVQSSLAKRPQGELPDTIFGAAPAYFLGTYKGGVSSILLRKDSK